MVSYVETQNFLKENIEIATEIKNKVLVLHGLLEDNTVINEQTGEIIEEETTPIKTKKTSKKVVQ